ncbi:MAG: helix-turn-helix domain-containing protein [Ruminococcaceae bacterium]|nr:helix-turn-helix domain-containing protein [Oscillospiraceae bacterium]
MNLNNGMTTEDVAKLLNVSDRTIRNYCKSKKLEHYRIANKIVILPEDLEKFIESMKVKGE